MARFARDIQDRLRTLLSDLETTLGPDTADLGLRVGLHSGPVTAGVLRGERARFQLFGYVKRIDTRDACCDLYRLVNFAHVPVLDFLDSYLSSDTMNTTSRMESTGEKNRIHCSQETADLLAKAGKQHWFFPREEKVFAKGKVHWSP